MYSQIELQGACQSQINNHIAKRPVNSTAGKGETTGHLLQATYLADDHLLIIIQLPLRFDVGSQDVLPEIPRQHCLIMVNMLPGGNGKHLVQLFEGQCFGLWEAEVTVYPTGKVPRCIPSERTLGGELFV